MKLLLFLFLNLLLVFAQAQSLHFRHNLLGYHPKDSKLAFVLSDSQISSQVELREAGTDQVVFKAKPTPTSGELWGNFAYAYQIDFSAYTEAGTYFLKSGNHTSPEFTIRDSLFAPHLQELEAFMRQQRCGYNPYFDVVCHQGDGRLFYAPVSDSTYYDFSGGWHDAGDQLKYLITSSNATARMLVAYELAPEQFEDNVNALGHPYPNGIPDILDEAKWGLDWILKLHPHPNWLIHQIADDRDHRGFKFPHKDNAEYGWGPNSYRAAYFATGTPQGLGKWKSKATGIANLAGRSAAALALGARIWKQAGWDDSFAQRCQQAAVELYEMGRKQEGYQQGNSHGAPYRYNEDSWEDDMEWGAAELFRLTGDTTYLTQAIHYAYLIQEDGILARDTMLHYQKYPFMNMGHYALFQVAPDSVKHQLAQWYQSNIEYVLSKAQKNAYQVGTPFLWCSNNLMVNFVTQVLLYERMTGDMQYHAGMLLHRDWLLGRNPWGTSMFTGIPTHGETPLDVHIPPRALLQQTPAGGLIDGPIYRSIHDELKGLFLSAEDELAIFQNDHVVYHDDIGDYSTNEPTMDGTADAILMWILLN